MKIINLKSLICLALFICLQPITGQELFREGYIIKSDGSYLTGLIKYSGNKRIPENCTFKRFEISEQVVLSKDRIKEFGYLNGNRFVLKKYKGTDMFFEILVSGKLKLYKNNEGLYLEKDESPIVMVTNGEIIFYESGSKISVQGPIELLEHFTDNKVNPIAKETIAEEDLMISKVIEYNKISEGQYYTTNREFDESKLVRKTITARKNPNKLSFLIGTDLLMSFSPEKYFSLPAVTDMSTWAAGLAYERIVSYSNDRFLIGVELLYINQKFSQYYLGNKLGTVMHTEFFDFKEIKPAIYAHYLFRIGKVEPYISIGPSFRTSLSKDYLRITQTLYQGEVTSKTDTYRKFNSIRPDLLISAGLKIPFSSRLKLNLSVRIEGGLEGINTNGTTLIHNYYNTGILAGIQF